MPLTQHTCLNSNDMDRLNQLKFDPFQANSKIALSQNNEKLDSLYDISKVDCNYYLPDEFKKHLSVTKQKSKSFSLLHLNIRSISNKFDSFKQFLDTLDKHFQIIGLTETWLNDTNYDSFNIKDYEYIGSNRANKRGGGVCMYISKQLIFKIRDDLVQNIEDVIETMFIEICRPSGKNLIIGVIYRPPNSKFEMFENAINAILYKIERENKICYLAGDFNVDLLKSESCDFSNRFIEQLFTSSFFPLITKPTIITAHTATLIDNIYTK